MKNYIQAGENITTQAPAAVVSGAGVLIGDLFGIANNDAESGATVVLSTTGVYELPKVSTDAITVGASLYWDDAAELVTTDDATGTNPFIGYAVSAAANPSSAVNVRLSV